MTSEWISRAGALKRRYFPDRWELTALLVGGFLLIAYIVLQVAKVKPELAAVGLGAVVAVLAAFLGGTLLCFPLYFATTLGAEIVVPGVPVSLNRAFAALLLLATMFDLFRHRIRLVPSLALGFFVLFHLYFIPAAIILMPKWADYPVQPIFYLVPVAVLALLFWREDRMRLLVAAMVAVTMLVLALPGLIEYVFRRDLVMWGLRRYGGRVDGFSKNAVLFGQATVWAIPFALLLFVEARGAATRWAFATCALVLMFCAIVTLNRQTPIIMAAQLGTFLLLVRYRHRAALLATAIAGGLLALPLIVAKLGERFSTANSVIMDASLGYRHDKILVAMEMWKEHFWFGIGHDHFHLLWREYIPKGKLVLIFDGVGRQWIDSGYIQIITEYGAIGAAIFVLLMLSTALLCGVSYARSLRLESSWNTNMLAAIAATFVQFLVANLISDAFIMPRTLFTFGLLFACATAVELARRAMRDRASP